MHESNSLLRSIHQCRKWFIICLLMNVIIGSVTAFFLHSLDIVTNFRETHYWIIFTLPLSGLLIGFLYHHYGNNANKGNNAIIEAYHNMESSVPFKMAPLVYIGTILTHLSGGSAGREGTAVQMAAGIASSFTKWFKLKESEKKTMIIMGISAGFAAVFGTPLAGAVFALEMMNFYYLRWQSVLLSFTSAYIAHYTCLQWNIKHSTYIVKLIPDLDGKLFLYALLSGVLFGLTALIFFLSNHLWENIFNKINYKPLRTFIGGIIIVIVILLLGSTKFIGLGIPEIKNAFTTTSGHYDFIIKLLLTSFTISVGFKGGEVTPLFFIGATLGSSLVLFIPLPFALLAAMGFVAVFAGATHCVIASIILGIELFGGKAGIYIGIASIAAYFCSGPMSIYSAKLNSGAKFYLYNYFKKNSRL